ncbi:MAG: hypothetical protein IT435_06175 [Phycisphaerales bacterium]|nr:hypothetical protein [Phycisphaerales bacterium]
MASELRRGLIRITSSYGRLGLSLAMGIVWTRVMLGWLGPDAYGLIVFVSSSVGLALLIDEVVRASMIRELAAAHHADTDGSRGIFRAVINAGSGISCIAAIPTALLFLILALCIPVFKIDPALQRAAFWLILAEGVHTFVMVLTAPIYNMFVVTERFVADNLFTTIRKASYLIVAFILETIVKLKDPSESVIWYGFLSVGANIVILLLASAWIMFQDPRLRPRPLAATRGSMKAFLGTFGWNTSMMVAVNCYDRLGQLITNIAFGTIGNTIFGIGYQLAAYVRMVSLGVNFGSEAVAARLAASDTEQRRLELIQFITTMTRLHAFAAFPFAAILACLTTPIMHLWVGDRITDPAHLAAAITTAHILLVPVTVRSVTDCWTKILYGAGYIHRYAPLLLTGGIINPIVAVILLVTLPDPYRQYSAVISFAVVMTIFHFFLLPISCARCLGCRYRTVLLPIIRPAFAAIIPLPVLLFGIPRLLPMVGGHMALALPAVAALYGALYFGLSLVFVLKPEEKRRFTGVISRRLRTAKA